MTGVRRRLYSSVPDGAATAPRAPRLPRPATAARPRDRRGRRRTGPTPRAAGVLPTRRPRGRASGAPAPRRREAREATTPPTATARPADRSAPGTIRLLGVVSGELAARDVPLGGGVDVAALTDGDERPLEVVVSVPAGTSTRGWHYRPAALRAIVDKVNAGGLPGFLGHQKAEDVAHEFPRPVTHWVGGLWRDEDGAEGTAYFRGVVDPGAADLKRWLRGKAVRQVSIYGRPDLQTRGGQTDVVGYDPLSIDWTPLHRAGMPTAVVALGPPAAGEFDETLGGAGSGPAAPPTGRDGAPQEGDAMELTDVEVGALVGEMRRRRLTPREVVPDMQWPSGEVAGAAGLDLTRLEAGLALAAAVANEVGLSAADQQADGWTTRVLDLVKQGVAARREMRSVLVEKTVAEMVAPDALRPVIRDLVAPRLSGEADGERIKAVVGEVLALDHVRALVQGTAPAPAPAAAPVLAPRTDQRAAPAPATTGTGLPALADGAMWVYPGA